jgi:hypothetical protein
MTLLTLYASADCKESMVTVPVMVVPYDRVFVFESFRAAFRERRRLYAGRILRSGNSRRPQSSFDTCRSRFRRTAAPGTTSW